MGPGMIFLDNDTCTEGGGLFIFAMVLIHVWMDDKTDGWMDGWTGHVMKKLHEKWPQHHLLYVIVA